MANDLDYEKANWTGTWYVIDNQYVYRYTSTRKGKKVTIERKSFDWNNSCHWDQFGILNPSIVHA